jgi:trk system potassium uptake protein TrkH
MLLRPTADDVRVIARTTGLAVLGLGAATSALGLVALLGGDVESSTALLTGGAVGIAIGGAVRLRVWSPAPLSWTRGVVAATLTWLTCSLVAAIPLYLSRHYATYLDAYFEAMSGLTTTGLTTVQDLDHMPLALGMYRHLLELLGGLAFVVVGLTVLTAATATASSLTPSDVRDERILPSPERTWRQVWSVASVVLGFGLVLCTITIALAGMRGWSIVAHATSLTVSAATTGGFTLQSTSVTFYHSPLVEGALVPLMLAGAISFAIHRAARQGRRWELTHEFELRILLLSLAGVAAIVLVGLGRSGSQVDVVPLLRRGAFTAVAAQTTTGLTTVTPRLIATDWGQLAPAALVAGMTIGGMTGAPAGGLKTLRVGVILKGLVADVRRVLLPESALIVPTFRWGRERHLEHAHVRSAATLLLITLAAVLTAATVVLFVDGTVDLTESLFTATSAVTNSGQSIGAFGPETSGGLKVGFLSLMLLGRLEWLAVFATIGFAFAGLRGRA